jgi:hypothetical protein
MVKRYAIKTRQTYEKFLERNPEVKLLSYEEEAFQRNGRVWIEDKYGNMVLFITNIPDKLILEIRCYAPYDPSYVLFILVNQESSQIMLRDNLTCWRHPANYSDEDYKKATEKFLLPKMKNENNIESSAKSLEFLRPFVIQYIDSKCKKKLTKD